MFEPANAVFLESAPGLAPGGYRDFGRLAGINCFALGSLSRDSNRPRFPRTRLLSINMQSVLPAPLHVVHGRPVMLPSQRTRRSLQFLHAIIERFRFAFSSAAAAADAVAGPAIAGLSGIGVVVRLESEVDVVDVPVVLSSEWP